MMGSMLPKQILTIVLYGIGLTSITAMVYLAGPMIAFGSYRPLENYIVRQIVVVLVIAAFASFAGFKFFRRKKAVKALADGVTQDDQKDSDEVVLKERLKDALATLKASSGGKKDYLYDLPWYLLIGPPGSGKTTALVNSGLKFPLSGGATPAAIAGVGGTRYCDWWFTEDAVLIDTAGRYTTHDSDAKLDKESWLSFLDLLKKSRPRQPINGVMVAISLEDLMTLSSTELAAHANAIRARLLELHDRLKVDFPVYALFTKGDLIAGFVEYFGSLGENGRKQVWGATFQTADKTRNLVGEIPVEFDLLLERLSEDQIDRLQEEPAPDTRVLLFGFATQMARLKQPLFNFLNQIFEPTRYHVNATLRGFYFTSGTQQGTPIDQLIGSLTKTFGAENVAPTAYSGLGKSFFLHDLILKVVIGEAAWVTTDRAAVRRAMIMKSSAIAAITLITFGAMLLWFVSYQSNRALIDQTASAYKEYQEAATAAGPYLTETMIEDRSFHKILPLLDRLRNLPAGYATRNIRTPWAAAYGLSQRERLQSASENLYRIGLERMFRSRLLFRLEELLDARINDPGFVYDALKVYLMLGGQQPADLELIKGWMQRDWASQYPGATNTPAVQRLEDHLAALFNLAQGDPLIELDRRLINEGQKTLARLSIAERAYALLKSQSLSSAAGDWLAPRKGGSTVGDVFETTDRQPLDTVRVPEFFTYNGFYSGFIARLGDVSERIKAERWVLGDAARDSAIATQFDNLPNQMLEFYTRDFLAAWQRALGRLRMRKLLADKPQYITLSAIGAPSSPLKQLLVSIAEETSLTRERPAAQAGGAPDQKSAKLPTSALSNLQGGAPGAAIEERFKPFRNAIEGNPRAPIDDVITNFNDIAAALNLATDPTQAARANIALQEQIAKLRNNTGRLPAPFSDFLRAAVREFEDGMASSTAGQLQVALRNEVFPVCQQTIANRYPFTRGSDREVPLADFARVFAPNVGVMDKFFKQYLEPHADTSKPRWVWRPGAPVSSLLSPETLRSFQLAALIRDAYFQTGGNVPTVSLAIRPPVVSDSTVEFETGGTVVRSKGTSGGLFNRTPPHETSPTFTTIQWPGASVRTAISVTASSGQPIVLERSGAWSLFRLLEAASLTQQGETAKATYLFGGQELQFQITTNSIRSPLDFASLREFRCPTGI